MSASSIMLNLVMGVVGTILQLAIWRLLIGFLPVEEPTKWALVLGTLSNTAMLVAALLGQYADFGLTVLLAVVSYIALAGCWYLWVVKAKREGHYYG